MPRDFQKCLISSIPCDTYIWLEEAVFYSDLEMILKLNYLLSKLWIKFWFSLYFSDMVIMKIHFNSFEYETQILYQQDFFYFLCELYC